MNANLLPAHVEAVVSDVHICCEEWTDENTSGGTDRWIIALLSEVIPSAACRKHGRASGMVGAQVHQLAEATKNPKLAQGDCCQAPICDSPPFSMFDKY